MERENLEEKYPTHPAILAFFEVFGDMIDKQLLELRKQGMLPNENIIYQRKPSNDTSQEKKE